MPISRDPRNDRRRRVLRDHPDGDALLMPGELSSGPSSASEKDDEKTYRRSAGYSQEVRKACGHRLVQLIPVRRRSFLAAILLSTLIPILLLTGHYMIYVSGSLKWYGHPLAVSLDASDRRSIAAWFCSQLWIFCLATTVLTFQLRRHKLDDYGGEYRLWFWLVITCLAASIDATTHISQLIGLALDQWSQLHLGWTGPALVEATLAVLIGLLGLRLCSELKAVPTSLIFWLGGLIAWAGSAALAQEELRLDITLQERVWLKAALWMGGLTAVWLAALSYLRSVYIEAQQRFLVRGRLAYRGTSWGQRTRNSKSPVKHEESEDTAPSRTRWRLPAIGFSLSRDSDKQQPQAKVAPMGSVAPPGRNNTQSSPVAQSRNVNRPDSQRGINPNSEVVGQDALTNKEGLWSRFTRRAPMVQTAMAVDEAQTASKPSARTEKLRESGETQRTGFQLTSWIKRPKDSGEAEEFKKVNDTSQVSHSASAEPSEKIKPSRRGWFARSAPSDSDSTAPNASGSQQNPKRRWFHKTSRPDGNGSSKPRVARKIGGFFARFKLQPPTDANSFGAGATAKTNATIQTGADARQDDDDPSPRTLTKAERKRLRRMQQQQDRAA